MANILIIGDGAIGLLLSHFLSKAHSVHVLTRKATANTRFYCKAKQPSQKINARFITLKQINEQPAFDIVIFAPCSFSLDIFSNFFLQEGDKYFVIILSVFSACGEIP